MARLKSDYDFDEQPHLLVAAFRLLATKPKFLTVFRPILDPDDWSEKETKWVITQVIDQFDEYQSPVGLNGLQMRLDTAKLPADTKKVINLFLHRMGEVAPTKGEQKFIRDAFEGHIQYRATLAAIKQAHELTEEGRFEEAVEVVQESQLVKLVEDDWLIVPDDIERYFEFFAPEVLEGATVGTGLPSLDAKIGGGLRTKELGIVIAATGGGKSMFLVQMGCQALLAGKRVLHISFENSREETLARYSHHLLKIDSDDLQLLNADDPDFRELLEHAKTTLGSRLYVKELIGEDTDSNGVAAVLARLSELDMPADMLIVDYADLMRPVRERRSEYEEQSEVYKNLRTLAQRYDVAIWTASQGNREGNKARRIGMHHVAGAFNKSFVADLVLSISREKKEQEGTEIVRRLEDDDEDDPREREDNGERIVHILKLRRSGRDNFWLRARAHFAQARFVEVEAAEDRDKPDDVKLDIPDVKTQLSKRAQKAASDAK